MTILIADPLPEILLPAEHRVVLPRGRHRVTLRTAGTGGWLTTVAVLVVALAVRSVGLASANDVFIDELTYSTLSSMLADGQLPALFNVPFFLHPPGALLPDAATIRLFDLSGGLMDLALDLRWVHAVEGAVVVALGYRIARLVSSNTVALLAATVLIFDPFLLRVDTRVMLETFMAMWAVAGLLMLLAAGRRLPGRPRIARECLAGLLFGFAVLSKDMVAIPIVIMIGTGVLWRRTVPVPTALRLTALLPVPYLGYLATVAQHGLLPVWVSTKVVGLHRLVGEKQETGFNVPGAPSLVSRLVVQLTRFGTSYVLIGICLIVGIAAAFSRNRGRRVVGLFAVGAGLLGSYAAAAGTLEEQFGYIVVVASVLATAATAAEALSRYRLRRIVTVTAIVFVALTCLSGAQARLSVDDGYVRVRAFLQQSVPAGARVGFTGVTAEFGLLPHDGYAIWPSLESLARNHADYVVTESAPLSQGYGYAAPELLTWLGAHARPVFRFTGPTNGATVVWALDRTALDAAVAQGITIPPVKGGYR